ncbi:MAG: D-alanine--D-alanine ligase [bacterium]
MKVALLHSQIPQGAARDDLDLLVQVDAVSRALDSLGFEPVAIPFSLDIEAAKDALHKTRPGVVFNLVETVDGRGQLIHLAPSILDHLRLPYTGSGTEALFLTSNKLLAKKILKASGIPTPPWITRESSREEPAMIPANASCIIKSVWEHASIGMSESSVITLTEGRLHHLRQEMERFRERCGGDCFAEGYIDGREFNLSLLAGRGGDSGLRVLPPAEIRFEQFPDGKLKIVDYRAKWEEESFEYQHTPRCFDFPDEDGPLLERLVEIAGKCWDIFDLRGYARVDFRVDHDGNPWVLEVNANPCISPDSGFAAAASQAGLSYEQLVHRIIVAAGAGGI